MERFKNFIKNPFVVVILCLIVGFFIGKTLYFTINNKGMNIDHGETVVKTSAERFKEEYESLNGLYNDSGVKAKTVNVDLDNPVKYVSYKKAYKIFSEGTGVIYLGFNSCPWCRNVVETLLEAAKDNEIKELYYINITDSGLLSTVDNNGKLVEDTEQVQAQYNLLKALYENNVYGNYKVENDEYRIYSPTVLFIKNGELVYSKVSSLESVKDPYKDLTKEQHSQLYSIYNTGFAKIK